MQHDIPELNSKGLRKFAITTGAIVAVLFGLFFPWVLSVEKFPIWPWIIFAIFSLWGLIAPSSLRPVYYLWMRLGLVLNKISTPIIMGIVFFLVLAPTALFMRAVLKRDPLNRKIIKDISTYRVESTKPDPNNLRRPF
jgi:hypothetical protein